MVKKKIKVLIIDDSAVVRKVISEKLSRFDDIEIVGTAVDAYVARDKILELHPDVVTLDLEMPRMDGLSFLEKLMKHYPMPVVVLSSLTPKNSKLGLKALDLGAVEVLCKPGSASSTKNIAQRLVHAIRTASAARINKTRVHSKVAVNPVQYKNLLNRTTPKLIAIGASTGGTKAIEALLTGMPADSPGIVIVQHMPENFTSSFARRLNNICALAVREACENDHVVPGQVLIAPGNHHMVIHSSGGTYSVKIKDGPRVHYQRPSVDVMFRSVAKNVGSNAVGVILTGMGADGAKGMLVMRKNGAITMAQDEDSCVIFGMPREAIKYGGVDQIVPLQMIPQAILNSLQSQRSAA